MPNEIWILSPLSGGALDEEAYGLVNEARRLRGASDAGLITLLVPGGVSEENLVNLGSCGVDRVLVLKGPLWERVDGEQWVEELTVLARKEKPRLVLLIHNALAEDLGPRLAASLETGFISRAMDLRLEPPDKVTGVRPIDNGYLFEEIAYSGGGPSLVSFLPSVLTGPEKGEKPPPEVETVAAQVSPETSRSRVLEVIAADPESAALEDAEIIVAGGRGVGKGEAFALVSALARALGGSVAGTRPVIDWQTLPFERQIGQTGKTVTPRLLIACGISGANEFTAGMEKSQWVIAVNNDPRARIFRFADLGVVGDLHEILPKLIERIEQERRATTHD